MSARAKAKTAAPKPKAAKATIKTTPQPKARPVIVCTKYRGVFFGYAKDTTGGNVFLAKARMVMEPGTKAGITELADTGPTDQSRVSARADIEVRKAIAVMEVKEAAVKAWESKKDGWQ